VIQVFRQSILFALLSFYTSTASEFNASVTSSGNTVSLVIQESGRCCWPGTCRWRLLCTISYVNISNCVMAGYETEWLSVEHNPALFFLLWLLWLGLYLNGFIIRFKQTCRTVSVTSQIHGRLYWISSNVLYFFVFTARLTRISRLCFPMGNIVIF